MVTEEEDANNKEYAAGYGSGRSSDIVRRTIAESPFGLDRNSVYYKGYEAGVQDQRDHGFKSADDCGTGESDEPVESSSCCYIVGACLDDLHLPRTSQEMLSMKTLAKDHILKSFSGKRDYVRYGRIGPRIVQAIRSRADSQTIWRRIHGKLQEIAPKVKQGQYQEAYEQYRDLVFGLEAQLKTAQV